MQATKYRQTAERVSAQGEFSNPRDAEITAAVVGTVQKLSNESETRKATTEGDLEEHAVAEAETPERETDSLGRRLWDYLFYVNSRLLKLGRGDDPMVNVEIQGL